MAASNYMTEADTESIWSATLDTTRFGTIGVRLAEILNFWIYKDATNQCTNTAVTPILEQISEEGLIRLLSAAKESAVTTPWEFIKANTVSIMSTIINENREILEEIKTVLSQKPRIKFFNHSSTFPSHKE